MEYIKGDFTVVPNRGKIRGEQSHVQSVYMWMCAHSDTNGRCFPSIKTLAEEAGCGERTVYRSIARLVEIGVLNKTNRFGDNQKLSNEYQIMLNLAGGTATGAVGVLPEGHIELYPYRTIKYTDSSNSSDSSFEVTAVSERETNREKPDTTKKYDELCKWAEARRGFPFVSRVKQYSALKKARSANISISALKRRWEECEDEPWRDGFDWTSVVSSFDKRI